MATTTITDEEEGKDVVDGVGEKIGIVSGVREGTPYVDPDPAFTDRIKTLVGMEDVDESDYPLDTSMIAEITDDEVRLEREM